MAQWTDPSLQIAVLCGARGPGGGKGGRGTERGKFQKIRHFALRQLANAYYAVADATLGSPSLRVKDKGGLIKIKLGGALATK